MVAHAMCQDQMEVRLSLWNKEEEEPGRQDSLRAWGPWCLRPVRLCMFLTLGQWAAAATQQQLPGV